MVHWYPPEQLDTGQATVNYRNRPELIPLPDEDAPWPWETAPEPAAPAGDSSDRVIPEAHSEPEPEPEPPGPPGEDTRPSADIEEPVFEFQLWDSGIPPDPPDTPNRRVITDEEFLAAFDDSPGPEPPTTRAA